jgi:tetratricopeptide (TPR) repeat protein
MQLHHTGAHQELTAHPRSTIIGCLHSSRKTAAQQKEISVRNSVFRSLIAAAVVIVWAAPVIAQEKPVTYNNPAISDKNSAAYWLDRGGLFATYGNYQAAVAAYKKALQMDGNLSKAHFDMGVAYGEMGDFDQALSQIDTAITLSPDTAAYYYGRGRVLLLAGRHARAMEDFQKAAAMGNRDAKAYLGK